MATKDTIKDKLGIQTIVSPDMANALRVWKNAYINKSAWLNEDVESLNIPATVASEVARLVTIENKIEITGSEKADFIDECLKYFKTEKKNIVEMACAKGGMYFKPYVAGNNVIIDFIYQDEAIPFKYDGNRNITGVIFPSYIFKNNRRYTRLEIHDFSEDKYTIENKCFVSKEKDITDVFSMNLGNEISLESVEEWKDIEPLVSVNGVDYPFYSYMRIPIANNIDLKSPLGVSVYARAIKDIKKADKQMARLDWEFESKETAIEMAESYMKQDAYGSVMLPKGKERLYRTYEDESLEGKKLFELFSPEIRDQSYVNGLNKYLQQIEFKCSLAYGTISDPQQVDKTAEEIKTSKQRSYQLVSDIQESLENAINGLIVAIDNLITAYELCPDGNVDVTFQWDDSIIVDSEKEKQQDIQDVNLGIMAKWEYRVKWYGETEEKAKAIIAETNSLSPGLSNMFGEDDE